MKKIFFAALMLLTVGGISYAQTTPAKTNPPQKKEVTKKESKSTVNSVTPANTTKNTATSTKTKTTTKTSSKPAATKPATKPATTKQPAHTDADKNKKKSTTPKKE